MSQVKSPYVEAHPNPEVAADRRRVIVAIVILVIFSVINLLVGAVYLFQPEAVATGPMAELPRVMFQVAGAISLAWGALYLILGILIGARSSLGAARAAFVMSIIELVLTALSLNLIGAGVGLLKVWLLRRGRDALDRVRYRIWQEEQQNALTAWYHAYVPLLVHVMEADGEIQDAEVAEMQRHCAEMNVSELERAELFRKAREQRTPVREAARRYLEVSRRIEMAGAEEKLITALAGMAAADRVLRPEERDVIHRIAEAVGYPAKHVDEVLARTEQFMAEASREDAARRLGVPLDADRAQLDARYAEIARQLQPAEYAHLGGPVLEQVQRQRQALDADYRLLTAGA